jgi:hypothetical protein
MSETPTHRGLVELLASRVAADYGVVTHADGFGTYDTPPAVGRHEPDVLARDANGRAVIGEAKQGDDLFTDHSQEQLCDFSTQVDRLGRPSLLVLGVPAGWATHAYRAVRQAGGDTACTTIIEFDLPGAPRPPDVA